MNTAYFYLTDEGRKLAHKLATAHPGDIYNKENFKENLRAGYYFRRCSSGHRDNSEGLFLSDEIVRRVLWLLEERKLP